MGAWRGIGGFEGRSSLRAWLYRIATNAALRIGRQRPRRQLSVDLAPPCTDPYVLGDPLNGSVWLEPYPGQRVEAMSTDPATAYEAREAVELAFVAAVNSQLQRARATLARRLPDRTQQAVRAELGTEAERRLVADLVAAWEGRDVDAFVALLVEDARLCMPPLPAWFDGVAAIRGFLARMFQTPWRLDVTSANGQSALVCWQGEPDGAAYHPGGTIFWPRVWWTSCT